MLTAIRQWVIRTMMKSKGQTGVVQTLPKRDLIELNTQITAQKLMQGGIDPNSLKNADQVENAIIAMESRPKVQEGIRSTSKAKVFDLEGKEIKNTKNIMGGKEVKETEAEIAKRIGEGNKQAAKNLRMKKIVDDAIDNMSPSLSGDTRTDAALVAEDMAESMGKVYDDLSQMEQLDLYDQAYTGLSKIRFKGFKKPKDDPEDMAQGGRAGFFMGGPNFKGLGLLRQILNYMSKKGKETGGFKGIDVSGLDMLRLSNPKRFNKLLEDVRGKVNIKEGIMGTDTVRAQQQALRGQRKGLTEKSLDVAKAIKEDQDRIAKRIEEETRTIIIPKVKKQLMEGMGMSEEVAEKAAIDMAEAAQNIKLMDSPPKITEEGILQLENVLKNMETGGKTARELNATGGRIGFKDGMSRRTFLKLLGGLASIPIVGKLIKPLKLTTGVTKVPIIKTDNVPGKPEWFDALVNKVIIEGDDVTKKFATGERQSIHQKTLDDGSVVRVTEDVDQGAVRVEYESQESMFGEPVQMEYKKPKPDEGDPRPAAEFEVSESGIVSRADGPDDFVLEGEQVSGSSIRDLDSDVSKLKQYATGKGPTMQEIVEIKKRKDKVKRLNEGDRDETSQYISDRQGDYDPSPDDYASGGIARMLGE